MKSPVPQAYQSHLSGAAALGWAAQVWSSSSTKTFPGPTLATAGYGEEGHSGTRVTGGHGRLGGEGFAGPACGALAPSDGSGYLPELMLATLFSPQ